MKVLISIAIIAAALFLGWKLLEQWDAANKEKEAAAKVVVPAASTALAGMRDSLETALSDAQRKGAAGLRDFLARNSKYIKDPKLGAIELDYVVLVAKDNPAEARKVFTRVKQRTPTNSPIYPRVKQLEKTYE